MTIKNIKIPSMLETNDGLVVLATGKHKNGTSFKGVVLSSRTGVYKVGTYVKTFGPVYFEPCNGKVVLNGELINI